MHAALVEAWGETPKYGTFDLPTPSASQVRIKVIGGALHMLVRGRASGQHYSVAGTKPPHIPGSDGVGRIAETGQLVYFNALGVPTGSFAEEINVEKHNAIPLADGADADTIAVLVNPAMSSWMALTARAGVAPGEVPDLKIAVLGATGVSGQVAVSISKVMGASEITAIGRPGPKLEKTKTLGATSTIELAQNLHETDFSAAADADIVLDYLWGATSKAALSGIIKKRKDKNQKLAWIEIGAITGDDNAISGALLRQANIELRGCGPGAWSFKELGQQLPLMIKALVENDIKTEFQVKDLADVESWWSIKDGPRILAKP